MRSRYLAVLLFLIAPIVYQSCDTTLNIEEPVDFIKYIGGNGNQTGVDLVTDADGNIFILGTTESPADGMQLYVVMTSPRGEVLWEKTIGDAGEEDAKDLELKEDGNLVILANHTDPITPSEKTYVIYELDPLDGSIVGVPVVESETGVPLYANSITRMPADNGFVVAAYVEKSGFKQGRAIRYHSDLIKFDDSEWITEFSQAEGSAGYDVVPVKVLQARAQDTEDTFFIFCYSNTLDGDGINDYNVVVYPRNATNGVANGLFKAAGVDPSSNERLVSVKEIPSEFGGGYILTGYTSNTLTNQESLFALGIRPVLVGVPPTGPADGYVRNNIKSIPPSSSPVSTLGGSVYASAGSGFYVLGGKSSDGNSNIYLTKLDNSLAEAWTSPHTSATFGGISDDLPGAVVETSSGRILVCGTIALGDLRGQTKIVLMNLSPNGMFGE